MSNEYLYDLYRIAFLSVKQNSTAGIVNAAKPALIIAVIKAIEEGVIKNNQIRYHTKRLLLLIVFLLFLEY